MARGLEQQGERAAVQRRVRVVVNPSARGGRGVAALSRLMGQHVAGGEIEWVQSRSAEHFVALVRAAQDEPLDALAVAGGDGTVTLAAAALRDGQRLPLGVLPIGSGNDFARDCGVPSELGAACAALIRGVPRRVDLGEAGAGGPRFGCVASVGLDELALRTIYASLWPRSKALNICAALRGLIAYRPRTVEVSWERGRFVGPVMFVAVTNTKSYGGGFRVSPAASIEDGRLDVCIVQAADKVRLLGQFPRILRGTHGEIAEVTLAQTPWARIRPLDRAPLTVCLDGELDLAAATEDRPIELRCLPGALTVLVPRAAAGQGTP
ncbi:MAG: diacylglycerol kinase family protein [Polyangia bacterium]